MKVNTLKSSSSVGCDQSWFPGDDNLETILPIRGGLPYFVDGWWCLFVDHCCDVVRVLQSGSSLFVFPMARLRFVKNVLACEFFLVSSETMLFDILSILLMLTTIM